MLFNHQKTFAGTKTPKEPMMNCNCISFVVCICILTNSQMSRCSFIKPFPATRCPCFYITQLNILFGFCDAGKKSHFCFSEIKAIQLVSISWGGNNGPGEVYLWSLFSFLWALPPLVRSLFVLASLLLERPLLLWMAPPWSLWGVKWINIDFICICIYIYICTFLTVFHCWSH